jgi:guanosine-3',5'-bis(diphosphate) 3'-pyrophosphohydrolase
VSDHARTFAVAAHGAQKYGDQPYQAHLSAVVQVLADFGYFGEWAEAGWLHDTLEDTHTNRNDLLGIFGLEVISLVWAVTGIGANRKERNADIYRKCAEYPRAVVLKLADRIANVESAQLRDPKLHAMYAREAHDFWSALGEHGDPRMWRRLDKAYRSEARAKKLKGASRG